MQIQEPAEKWYMGTYYTMLMSFSGFSIFELINIIWHMYKIVQTTYLLFYLFFVFCLILLIILFFFIYFSYILLFGVHSFIICNCSVPSQLRAKMHKKSPSVMAFWLVCLGILTYSCQNTSRDNSYWIVTFCLQLSSVSCFIA